jgi:DNA-binding GntR family transcriptional regulator
LNARFVEVGATHHGQRDGHILHALLALLRGDNYFVERDRPGVASAADEPPPSAGIDQMRSAAQGNNAALQRDNGIFIFIPFNFSRQSYKRHVRRGSGQGFCAFGSPVFSVNASRIPTEPCRHQRRSGDYPRCPGRQNVISIAIHCNNLIYSHKPAAPSCRPGHRLYHGPQRTIRAVKSLYEKTIAFVLQYLDERKLGAGDQLPTETQLSSLAGVSLVTVRRALAELSARGVVRREQGRGTFVARPRVNAETTKIGGLRHGLHLDARSKLQTRILNCTARSAAKEEAAHLGLSAGTSVWEISRLRLLNRRPMIWETSVIPKILAPDLSQRLSARGKPSLYDLLDEVYGLKESREEQTLMSRPASTREHELLDLMSFEWVVEVSGISFSTRHQAIDAFRMVFVAKAFTFRLETASSFFVQAVEVADGARTRRVQ